MDISIIGASGGCGREIVSQLIRSRLLERREILQLIESHPAPPFPYVLQGFRADLQDAYAEIMPELDVTHDPESIIGDVVVMCGGATFEIDPRKVGTASRDMLARANLAVFDRFARALAGVRKGHPPVVVVVSNPVELGVHVFSKYLPRENVIGMGAYSDSLRFRWEIAYDLGIRRQAVHGYVLGEHGMDMVPLWSSVRVQGMDRKEWAAAEKRLRQGISASDFPAKLQEEQAALIRILLERPATAPMEAMERISLLPPDLRLALKPFAIHYTSAKTLVATASATVELVKSIIEGRPVEIAAQVEHHGESGIHGPFGARIILSGQVEKILPVEGYCKEEMDRITESAANVRAKIEKWTSHDGK